MSREPYWKWLGYPSAREMWLKNAIIAAVVVGINIAAGLAGWWDMWWR